MRHRFLAIYAMIAFSQVAIAQEDKKTDDDKPADPDTGESTIEEKTLGLLPNPFQKYGVKFAATYIGESLGNVSGGLKRGAVYEGRLNLAVDVDMQKLTGIDQLTFHANMFQIHGGGLSRGSLQNLFVVSGIEALPSTRLYEAYFEKQWGNKRVLAEGWPACGRQRILQHKIHGCAYKRIDGVASNHFNQPPVRWALTTLSGHGSSCIDQCHRTAFFTRRNFRWQSSRPRPGRSPVARSLRCELPSQ